MNQYGPPGEKSPPLVAAAKGVSLTLSWVVAIGATPILHRLADPAIRTFAETQYGPGWGDLVSVGAFIAFGCLTFFLTHLAATATLLPTAWNWSDAIAARRRMR